MTQVAFPGFGLEFPTGMGDMETNFVLNTVRNINSTGAKVAIMGQILIQGAPASTVTKTISTSGSIVFRTGAVTFNSSTVIRVGLQDLNVLGPAVTPNGTSDVFRDINTTEVINANSSKSVTMSSGTKSIYHGQELAVVWEMRQKASTSALVVLGIAQYITGIHRPVCRTKSFSSAAWSIQDVNFPLATITFDDGTLGLIANSLPSVSISTETWTNATNPDERGNLFQVPQDVRINGVWAHIEVLASTTLFDFNLYSDPFGTPTKILTNSFLAHLGTPSGTRKFPYGPFDLVSLSKNTDYVLAVKANSTGTLQIDSMAVDVIGSKEFFGSSTLCHVSRNNTTGAFAREATSTKVFKMGINISSWDDGTGTGTSAAGAGMLYIPNLQGT